MKLNFSLLDQPIEIDKSAFFIIENPKAFAHVTKLLYQYEQGNELKLFDEKQKALKGTELLLVTDVFGYDVNSPAVLKLIYTDLEQQLNEKPEVKTMIEKLSSTISDLIGYELLEHELDLEEDEITILELFKALGIKIETKSDTFFEKLLEIMQITKFLSKKKLLVLVNVCSFLTKEELEELTQYISLLHIQVLFIEPRKVDTKSQYILDEDYFLYHDDKV
ncbi:type II-A CRISPR-associated protein Csn2 [Enterococcus sp. BWB1-3]|uniref:type II-A CRISPR-associated protein Csn2 n=1 Tax=unclassified Enterococcus TaxID=2608891 RepID=UPI00192089CE|nr:MULTISPECIES: type II-A CRISPR-associated protein Csn2 [unclassified Enterococcus]MBL1229086.1 type II-A CRISPR-associated protein Csn2 [Enterococcus sp. BWB1-3]MCB5952471.1 type II-A CRISPR-associated protein Csn2 [Enterococcus sp. BWT-B8]